MAEDAKPNRSYEENRAENRRYPGQKICSTSATYQAAAAAASNAERAAFRPLEKDEHDHRDYRRDVNDKKDGDHRLSTGRNWGKLPSYMTGFGGKSSRQNRRAATVSLRSLLRLAALPSRAL